MTEWSVKETRLPAFDEMPGTLACIVTPTFARDTSLKVVGSKVDFIFLKSESHGSRFFLETRDGQRPTFPRNFHR
jgi:hypothetical protein